MQVDNTVELIDHMGSDLTVVNAARVSFGKRKETFTISDVGLVQYLAKHNHWSPFGHASLQFHIKAPVFVARQLVKHQVGLVWNEISRRSVDDEPEFCKVDSWRARAENKKQGSDETKTIDEVYPPESDWKFPTSSLKKEVETLALKYYNTILESGVAPERTKSTKNSILPILFLCFFITTKILSAYLDTIQSLTNLVGADKIT